jgi:CBS-domain-containing membrane protein
MGSIISFMLLLTMDELFRNSNFHISLGPLSSGIAAHYLLCSAPASQPRTSVLALSFTGLISMIVTYLPIPIWTRVLSAAAVSVLGMAKLGVPYPPAASLAVAIAAAKTASAWGSLLLTVATSILLLIPAIFINNLNKNRQYPIYWGYNHCKGKLYALSDKQKEKS